MNAAEIRRICRRQQAVSQQNARIGLVNSGKAGARVRLILARPCHDPPNREVLNRWGYGRERNGELKHLESLVCRELKIVPGVLTECIVARGNGCHDWRPLIVPVNRYERHPGLSRTSSDDRP